MDYGNLQESLSHINMVVSFHFLPLEYLNFSSSASMHVDRADQLEKSKLETSGSISKRGPTSAIIYSS